MKSNIGIWRGGEIAKVKRRKWRNQSYGEISAIIISMKYRSWRMAKRHQCEKHHQKIKQQWRVSISAAA